MCIAVGNGERECCPGAVVLSAFAVPSCASTICFTMAKPSPVPSLLLLPNQRLLSCKRHDRQPDRLVDAMIDDARCFTDDE